MLQREKAMKRVPILVVLCALALLAATAATTAAARGPNASVKTPILAGEVVAETTTALIPLDPIRVMELDANDVAGEARLRTTKQGTVMVLIKLSDAEVNTTYDVRLVPKMPWAIQDQTWTLTTNRAGRGTLRIEESIPDDYTGNTFIIKVRLTDDTTLGAEGLATDVLSVDLP